MKVMYHFGREESYLRLINVIDVKWTISDQEKGTVKRRIPISSVLITPEVSVVGGKNDSYGGDSIP